MLNGGIKESNHRIANDLALIAGLIRAQAARLPDQLRLSTKEVRELLNEMSARIDAVGRLHRLLTRDHEHETVDLFDYLHEISEAAVSSLSRADQTKILIELEPECLIPSREATAIGLVLGEAITNALKHAHPTGVPGRIVIASSRNQFNGLVIEVADDGIGFTENFDSHVSQTTGIVLMRTLADQLGAGLEFKTSPVGLCVRLELQPPECSAGQEDSLLQKAREPAA